MAPLPIYLVQEWRVEEGRREEGEMREGVRKEGVRKEGEREGEGGRKRNYFDSKPEFVRMR